MFSRIQVFSVVLLVLVLGGRVCYGASVRAVVAPKPESRALLWNGETLSTTECNNVRRRSYQARLDISYFYLLEFVVDQNETIEDASLDFAGIDRAVAASLAIALDTCDDDDRPKYAIALSPAAHELSKNDGTQLGGSVSCPRCHIPSSFVI